MEWGAAGTSWADPRIGWADPWEAEGQLGQKVALVLLSKQGGLPVVTVGGRFPAGPPFLCGDHDPCPVLGEEAGVGGRGVEDRVGVTHGFLEAEMRRLCLTKGI